VLMAFVLSSGAFETI